MTQVEFFDESLSRRFRNLEKRMGRLQNEIHFIKNCYNLSKKAEKFDLLKKHVQQLDMFAS